MSNTMFLVRVLMDWTKDNKKIIVCIPGYNVAHGIRKIVQECLKYASEVVVCDDGSIDDTEMEAKRGGATVIKHSENKGKGAAMRSLFNITKNMNADVIVTIDGDGQFLPQEINKISKPVLDGKADIVIGCRFIENNEMPAYRKIGNMVLDKMTNMASELPFRDTQSGFRAYSNRALQVISFESDRFGADAEILVDASKKGLIIDEEKVTVLYNIGEQTSSMNPISHSKDVIGCLLELIALRRPLRYIGIPGISLTAIGIMYAVIVVSIFNHTRYFSIPSTLVAMGCLVMGMMLILMAVVLFSISRSLRRVRMIQ